MSTLGIPINHSSNPANSVMPGLFSYDISVEDDLKAISQKDDDVLSSSFGQGVFGFGLGAYVHKIYGPLTEKIVKILGVPTSLPDPFSGLNLFEQLFFSPFVCILGPIWEERMFRGDLQGSLKEKFEIFYANRGFSDSTANIAARVTAVFFTSVIFGLVHFCNAIMFWCNPVLFFTSSSCCHDHGTYIWPC